MEAKAGPGMRADQKATLGIGRLVRRAAALPGIRRIALLSLTWLCALPLSAAEPVHSADFESGRVPPEWNVSQTDNFDDEEKFLGEFGNVHAKLRLEELPK